jgi:hypothetical protein
MFLSGGLIQIIHKYMDTRQTEDQAPTETPKA